MTKEMSKVWFKNAVPSNFNGREGETATFFLRCRFNSNGLGGGFAPHQFNRSTFLGKIQPVTKITLSACHKNNFGGVFVNESFIWRIC